VAQVERVVLGRTGLLVSVAGLGCGGFSRLGLATHGNETEAVALVRRALELGITFVDTAAAYGTEEVVGRALAGHRHEVVLSTKALPGAGGGLPDAKALDRSLEGSLKRLGTDYVDVFHLHGVGPDEYDDCLAELLPALVRWRERGAVRFLAVSERFASDPGHTMLARAAAGGPWDVVMVGFNVLNQSARDRVLGHCIERHLGVEVMFAVRQALSQPEVLRRLVGGLVEEGRLDPSAVDPVHPLGFLVHEGGASSVVDAAYRFCRHEPGCHVVLTGTGRLEHLEENVRSINRGPLPAGDLARLRRLFGGLDHVSGEERSAVGGFGFGAGPEAVRG
jgi:L-galactose dehydrogenase